MVSWKQYYQEHTKGKKFKKGEIQEHMRKLAKEYHEMKGKGLSLKSGEGMKEEKDVKEEAVPMPTFLKEKEEDSKSEMGEEEEPKEPKEMEGGKMMKTPRRIDFSKIHWGAFTENWQDHGGKKKFKTLHDFAKAVLKNPKEYTDIILKRARFYKNIIRKGKGLSMI
jgi:hypothetical protein